MTDECKLNPTGHRYFVAGKTYTEFVASDVYSEQGVLYLRNEYAILSCNCGSVIRMKVKDA